MFEGIGGVGPRPPALTRHGVVYQGMTHHYFEQSSVPGRFLFLPDAFKLGRRGVPPYAPALLVSFTAADGQIERLAAEFAYVAYPVVDYARLAAAAPALRQAVPLLPAGVPVTFDVLRLRPDQLALRLALPTADGGVARQTRPDVVAALDLQIADSVRLDLAAFQAVFDALIAGSGSLLSGEVLVSVSDQDNLVVPFQARLADLAGRIFDEAQEVVSPGHVRVRLTNRCESPVRLPALQARLAGGGLDLEADVTEVRLGEAAATLPAVVPPDRVVEFVVTARTPPQGSDALRATYDLGGVEALPDPERVLASVLDQSVPTPLRRKLDVTVFRDVFDGDATLRRVVIDLSTGASLAFAPADFPPGVGEATKSVDVPLPLTDVLLRRHSSPAYRYRVYGVTSLGEQRETEWADGNFPLVPNVSAITGPSR